MKFSSIGKVALFAALSLGLIFEAACSSSNVVKDIGLAVSVGASLAQSFTAQGLVGGPAGVALVGVLDTTDVLLADYQNKASVATDVSGVATQLKASLEQLKGTEAGLSASDTAKIEAIAADITNVLAALPAPVAAARAGIIEPRSATPHTAIVLPKAGFSDSVDVGRIRAKIAKTVAALNVAKAHEVKRGTLDLPWPNPKSPNPPANLRG